MAHYTRKAAADFTVQTGDSTLGSDRNPGYYPA
jgi:hypothetical protein